MGELLQPRSLHAELSRDGENQVLGKMQTDALGPLFRLEVTAEGIGNHRVQFCERISLRSDAAAAARRVPARDIAAGFRTRLHLERDFSNRAQAAKLGARRIGINAATR